MQAIACAGGPGPDWTVAQLRDVATFSSGTTPSRALHSRYFANGRNRWVKTLDLNNSLIRLTDECVTDQALAETSLRTFPRGTVLVAMYGGFQQIGRTGLLEVPASVNQAITAITVDPRKVTPHYLLLLLNYRVSHWRSVASSSRKDPNITSADVKAFPVLLPGLVEQQRIVDVLAAAEQLEKNLEAVIAKKQAMKQGMMQQLLTGRIRLQGFDNSWTDIHLGRHVAYIKTVALSRAQLDATSPLKYLHYGDIHTSSQIFLNAADKPMPRASNALARSAGLLQVGDLIFADASEDADGVGRSVEVSAVPAQGVVPGLHTIAARFDKAVLADGFKAYLQFIPAFRLALLRLAAGTKVLATTRSYVSSITLSVPPIDEQRAIANALTDCEQEIVVLRRRLVKAQAIKLGMMQQLLTGRTRLPVEATS